MRITVCERVIVEQMTRSAQMFNDLFVGVPDRHAPQPIGNSVVVGSVSEHRAVDVQPLAQTGLIVLLAVPGRGVDQPRAVLQRDIISQHNRAHTIAKWVPILQTHEVGTSGLREHFD